MQLVQEKIEKHQFHHAHPVSFYNTIGFYFFLRIFDAILTSKW